MPGSFDHLRDEELVTDFLRHREPDPERAKALWWELVARAFDRVHTTVATFRWWATTGRNVGTASAAIRASTAGW